MPAMRLGLLEVVPFLRPGLGVDRCPGARGTGSTPANCRPRSRPTSTPSGSRPDGRRRGLRPPRPWPPRPIEHVHDERAETRMRDLASGMLPLPNLWIRSAGVIVLLYGILGLVLIALAELGMLTTGVAVGDRRGDHHPAVRPRPLADGPVAPLDLQVLVGPGGSVARTPARFRHPGVPPSRT